MAKDPTDTSSVRIEFDQSTAGMARPGDLPDSGPAASGPSGASAVVAILAALGATALVVVLLRPDAGNSAVGEPVGVAAAPTTTSARPERFQPNPTSEPPSPSSTISPLDGLERVPLGGDLLDQATKIGDGWIALLEGRFGFAELVRSTDGLNWSGVSRRQLAGNVIGFGLVDDQLHVVLSTAVTANTQTEVQIWLLDDQANWQRVPEYGTYVSDGQAFEAEFSDAGIAVLTASPRPGPEPSPFAVGLLAGVLEADLAARVCTVAVVVVRPDPRTRAMQFIDCDGEVLAALSEFDLVGTQPSTILQCFDDLGNGDIAAVAFDAIRFSVNDEPSVIRFDKSRFPMSIEVTPEGVVAVLVSLLPFFPTCSELVDSSELRPSVHRWSRADGLVDLDVDLPPDAQSVLSSAPSRVSISARPDGSMVVVTLLAAYETMSDFNNFELLVESPVPGILQQLRGTERFAVLSADRLAVSNDAGDWNEIDLGPSFEGSLILATDEYAVVLLSDGPVAELVKIPFERPPG